MDFCQKINSNVISGAHAQKRDSVTEDRGPLPITEIKADRCPNGKRPVQITSGGT